MSARNDNIQIDQSVIESIRFYDPSECSSAIKLTDSVQPPQKLSRGKTTQIRCLN
jgi:hypothetical protein